MKYPNCNVNLVITDRSNVEIDYCLDCRGVWLDRGELDKIIERSSQTEQRNYSNDRQNTNMNQQETGYRPKKKESFLSDLFDF